MICSTLLLVTKDIIDIINTLEWGESKKLEIAFPRPSTDPQILIGLNYTSKLLTNTE